MAFPPLDRTLSINALYAATTTTGRDGSILYALPIERLPAIMRTYGWLTP